MKIPMVERKQLDLYSLHRLVQEEGRLEVVTKERKWSKIAGRLNYPNGKNVGTILKGHYERILYPYDIYMSGKNIDGAVSFFNSFSVPKLYFPFLHPYFRTSKQGKSLTIVITDHTASSRAKLFHHLLKPQLVDQNALQTSTHQLLTSAR